ncbi:DeoR/GlpR transcriptional regulator [Planosporangium thailandense]|uniref:Lactose phosphotransferase system repressor n=1 Tax=Planosporangium thailandense TaxID=765197 RepID=A0ABX0XV13_9ACTN|nr:DeoR/GlpR family DNA-binding transcription regulator [Planosporangium thailandense]NJC69235.1 DeoR/GlpR transcriptional regulator [Planosporangium thailandense]
MQPDDVSARRDGLDGRRLYAPERQERILSRARAEGRVDVAEVAEELQVTPETIRKDLQSLERAGFVRRVHGGALPVERVSLETSVAERVEHAEAKLAIARCALAEVPETGAIFIEAGSTTQRLAEMLPDNRRLVVITNSLPAALSLATKPNFTVITLGGRVRGVTLGEVGKFALRSLQELAIEVAFLGTNGISVHRGLTTPDAAEADIKQAIIKCADRRVLLADSSKIGAVALWRYGNVSDIHTLITDAGADPSDITQLRAAGPQVLIAE